MSTIDLVKGTKLDEVRDIKDFSLKDYQLPGDDVMLIFKRKLEPPPQG